MKKLLLTSVLALGISQVATFNTANAQSIGTPSSLIKNTTVGTVAQALYLRLHTVSIDQHLSEMNKDGVIERTYVAGFTIEGAIAYDHELTGDGLSNEEINAQRNAGFQILPYKLSYASDGRILVSTSLVAFNNMNKEMETDDLNLNPYGSGKGGFGVFDQIELINFQYNKDVARGLREIHASPISVNLKLGLFKSSDDQTFFALKAGVNPVGYHNTLVNDLNGEVVELDGFEAELRYGAEFVTGKENGFHIQAGVDFKHRWSMERWALSPDTVADYQERLDRYHERTTEFNNANADYEADKEAFEAENNFNTLSHDTYQSMANVTRPTNNAGKKPGLPKGGQAGRHLHLMTPTIKASWKINKKNEKRPMRIGVGLSGNIPLGDIIYGELEQDRTKLGNQELVTGKVFLNF